jgi:diguanylate cyclase (GGDEF)-like protein
VFKKQTSAQNAVLNSLRMPIAVLEGPNFVVSYANQAMYTILAKTAEEAVGSPFASLLPGKLACLALLEATYQDGQRRTHVEQEAVEAGFHQWLYEVWLIQEQATADDSPRRVALEMIEIGFLQAQAASVNEALLISAVRQHELVEEAHSLNTQLRTEIQERRKAELEIERLAFFDVLTELPNRRLLVDRLRQAFLACSRGLHHGAVFFIDLDYFKKLNDTHGHHVGDLLLKCVAQRLKHCVREHDTVARLAGDEFVILIEGLSEDFAKAHSDATDIGVKVLAALREPYLLESYEHSCTGSLGIALFDASHQSVEEVLNRADLALYKAKAAGKNSFHFFHSDLEAASRALSALDGELRSAISGSQLRLYYQPQVDEVGRLQAAEGLLRWEHPTRGLLLPMDFIPYAEDHAIIELIDLWVIETACAQLVAWEQIPGMSDIVLAVNISAREFSHPAFASRVLAVVTKAGANAGKLVLELTERVRFESEGQAVVTMHALKDAGFTFALDDFGIGYSSLSLLSTFPLRQVKIDRSFVSDLQTNRGNQVITRSVITLAKGLGLSVVAEGVEFEQQWQLLRDQGCDLYQGYLFGKPNPADRLKLQY